MRGKSDLHSPLYSGAEVLNNALMLEAPITRDDIKHASAPTDAMQISSLICLLHTTAQQGLHRGLDTPLSAPVDESQAPTPYPHTPLHAAILRLAAGGAQGALPLPHGLLFPQVKRGKLAHVQGLCLLFVENDQIQALRHRHRIRLTSRHERNAAQLERRSRVQCCRRVNSGGHAKATAHPRLRVAVHTTATASSQHCRMAVGGVQAYLELADLRAKGLAVIDPEPCR